VNGEFGSSPFHGQLPGKQAPANASVTVVPKAKAQGRVAGLHLD